MVVAVATALGASPALAAGLGTAATFLSTAATAVGFIRSGNAKKQENDFRARELREQNIIENQRLDRELAQLKRDQFKRRGATVARASGAGVQPLGSVEDILAEQLKIDLLDLETAKFNTALGVRSREAGAKFAEHGGKTARTSGFLSAAGSFANVDFGGKGGTNPKAPPKAPKIRTDAAGRVLGGI